MSVSIAIKVRDIGLVFHFSKLKKFSNRRLRFHSVQLLEGAPETASE